MMSTTATANSSMNDNGNNEKKEEAEMKKTKSTRTKVLLVTVGFASHVRWAEGYLRYSREDRRRQREVEEQEEEKQVGGGVDSANHSPSRLPSCDVELCVVPCDRWKWRMQTGAVVEIEELLASSSSGLPPNGESEGSFDLHLDLDQFDVILVDGGMLDITPLAAALLRRRRNRLQDRRPPPVVLAYMHENQLTTPFVGGDRDVNNGTHWHYGMAHLRSILSGTTDGFVFNSRTHLEAFSTALPGLVNEQCPRDAVDSYLRKVADALETRCTTLSYGLDLDGLLELAREERQKKADENSGRGGEDPVPVILWNARLEEDKDPGTFLRVLHEVRRSGQRFRIVVLGNDPSKGCRWHGRFRSEFGEELLHVGWCSDSREYARWLGAATVVVSTARHETFGISIVESVHCGAVPVLPLRLSYPEIFPPDQFPDHYYATTDECVDRLLRFLRMPKQDIDEASRRAQSAVSRFRWAVMGPIYDQFFASVASGVGVVDAGREAAGHEEASSASPAPLLETQQRNGDGTAASRFEEGGGSSPPFVAIAEADDPRVALYRPKSLRDHGEYHRQVREFRGSSSDDEPPSLHGGRRAMVRMLEAMTVTGCKIEPMSFLTTPDLAQRYLLQTAQQKNVPVYVAGDNDLLNEIRGQKLNAGDAILAIVRFPITSPLTDLIAKPPILVLDNIRNAENVGSILRTAFCLGITSVVASSNTSWAAIRDSRAARCSMGTIYYHRFHRADSLEGALAEIRGGGIQVYGVEIGPGAQPVAPHGQDRSWAAVLGNEDEGLTRGVSKACSKVVFVPQAHGDSLNVGHAAAITLFELGRECPPPKHDGRAACS